MRDTTEVLLLDMSIHQLTLIKRDVTGKAVKRLLSQGILPCVAYGKGVESVTAQIPYREFEKTYRSAGGSSLVDVVFPDGSTKKALITQVSKHPLTEQYVHVDLFIVDMKEKMKAKVPLNFVGESKAVKELGANLVKTLQELEIECLPDHLPSHIDISLEFLANIGDMIRISDIKLPEGVVSLDDGDVVIASVEQMKEEKEEAPASAEQEKAAIEKLQTEKQEKKTTKEGEEGEAK